MAAPEHAATVQRCVEKYTEPLRKDPDTWDVGLLNHYRADRDAEPAGRELLSRARAADVRYLLLTGDVDPIIPPSATERAAGLLGAPPPIVFPSTGHLPMDERPHDVAAALRDFIRGSS